MPDAVLGSLVENARARIVDFGQRILRMASLSGQEEPVAELVLAEMRSLGYAEARVDEAGNVVGCVAGGSGRSLLLHGHMDVVDPGDPSRWRHAPFSGDVDEGFLWGRGASDAKGPLTAALYALGLLSEAGLRPAGAVLLCAAVGEESGGEGAFHLVRWLKPDLAVICEPSSNTLRRGHRGRFEFIVTFRGRSVHASAPERGLNPHYSMSRFLLALRCAPLFREATFGGSSVAPTLAYVDQNSTNVIPSEVSVHLDWRNAPGESVEEAHELLAGLLGEAVEPGIQASIRVRSRTARTYTGLEQTLRFAAPSFCLAEDDPNLLLAQSILEEALERPVAVGVWTFCTDGGQLHASGIPCLGFGPGKEEMAHVVDEHLDIKQLLEATIGYMGLALRMGERP